MSHELTIRNNGTAEMAYVGDLPWHGLGQQLTAGASIEEWQAAAGMDWKIQRGFVRYATGRDQDETQWGKMDDKVVLFRGDNKNPLGVVTDSYEIVQPKAVVEFFRDLTDAAGFTLETAGTLFGGKRFWALASIGDSASVVDSRDKIKGYLMLSTSADGTLATEGRFTTIRVVCNNTLSAARQDDKAKVRLTHRTKFNPDQVKRQLGVDAAHNRFQAAMTSFRQLADTPLDNAKMVDQTLSLLAPTLDRKDTKAVDKMLRSKPVQRIGDLYFGRAKGAEYDGTQGTQYGWLQAITEYVDHEARAQSIDNRLNSAWFGRGSDLKEQAYEVAMASVSGATTYHTVTRSEPVSDAPAGLLDMVLDETCGK
jgi:phage/plasmid-like protein (TIGR03299 family)